MEFKVNSKLFHKNSPILINRIFLNKSIFFSFPNLLTNLSPPCCQHEVDEDVLVAEGLAILHAQGEHVPGRVGPPVPYSEDEGVAVSLAYPVAGHDVCVVEPDSSLLLYHP